MLQERRVCRNLVVAHIKHGQDLTLSLGLDAHCFRSNDSLGGREGEFCRLHE